MMPPPSLVHQRISKNIERLLDARLAIVRPDWAADREIGVLLPADEKYNPEPDVTVIDAAIEIGQIYAERFYFVAEVLSNSDRPEQRAGADRPIVLAVKLAYYQRHEQCRGVLIVRQDRIEADLHVREPTGWEFRALRDPADHILIPDIGDIGALADCYKDTPLARKTS
jgi:Uma2 family endonuclease